MSLLSSEYQGSPEVTTDTNGKQLWVESYLPYGHRYGHSSALNASTNHLWFTGKPQDSETGLVYMGARYYNPIAGRFLSIDPQSVTTDNIHGFNRYAYANNNPYRYVDPDGRMPLLALLAFPSAGAAMVQATVDAAVIVGGVYAMIHGNGGDDAGKGSSPANGSSQGDPNNGKGLNKALGAAGVAKGGGRAVEDLIKDSRPGKDTKGRTNQLDRSGGFEQANKDFDALSPQNVKDIDTIFGRGRTGTLSDGRQVNVRPGSSNSGPPTLEIQQGKNRIKFRFDE